MTAPITTERGLTTVVLASDSADLEQRIEQATDGFFISLARGPLPRDPAHLFDQLTGPQLPDVVVLHSDPSATGEALALAELFEQQCPTVSVVLVSDNGQEIGLTALRAGVHDVLHPLAEIADMNLVISTGRTGRQVAQGCRRRFGRGSGEGRAGPRPGHQRRLTEGWGRQDHGRHQPRGWPGQEAPNSTVIVDLDIQFGDVGSALA